MTRHLKVRVNETGEIQVDYDYAIPGFPGGIGRHIVASFTREEAYEIGIKLLAEVDEAIAEAARAA